MKQLMIALFTVALMLPVQAQIETPQPSPFSKIEQKVGLTDISVEYSRPSMKGRQIFGDLVPYGKMWRTGANKNTIISFSDDVVIADQNVKAGSYAIFVTPNEGSWNVMFYADTENWGTPRQWDDSKVVAKTKVETYAMPMPVETWTIMFGDLTNHSAELGFMWETTYAGVKIEVPTDKTVTASIEKVMAGPSAGDYYNAAVYYANEGKDLKMAEKWMNKAMSMIEKPGFWQLRQQSLIYAKMGDKKKAIEIAKASLEGAKAAGNADYIKMNTESLKEWGAM